jgi:hypothetical protein
MRYAFPGAITPFAAVLLLSRSDMIIVQMLNQFVHILQIADLASLPLAYCHLILAELIEILHHARMVVW